MNNKPFGVRLFCNLLSDSYLLRVVRHGALQRRFFIQVEEDIFFPLLMIVMQNEASSATSQVIEILTQLMLD